jgi:purine-binding chemotaxis protein CheW
MSDDMQKDGRMAPGQYLSFDLGGELYGVNILKVQEIKGWEEVRHLPDMPEYIKGVIDLRGSIVPIIDLRTRFRLKQAEYTPTTVVIVLAVERGDDRLLVGSVVDGVSDVLDIGEKDVRRAPDLGSRVNKKYISGMASKDGRMVILLDMDKLFSAEEMVMLDSIV